MIDEKPQGEVEPTAEPHLADVNTLADAAMWVVQAAVGGFIGNATYDVVKSRVGPWLRRYGRRALLDKAREEAKKLPLPTSDISPPEVERRVEELLSKAEDEDE